MTSLAVLLATLTIGQPADTAATWPTPTFRVTTVRSGSTARLVGRFDLDSRRVCQPFDYANNPNLEPDLGEAGTDTCGPPVRTVTVRLRSHGVTRVFRVAERQKRGVWRATVQCGRWSATLVNPWFRRNLTVAGYARCAA